MRVQPLPPAPARSPHQPLCVAARPQSTKSVLVALCIIFAEGCGSKPTESAAPPPVLESVQTIWNMPQRGYAYVRPHTSPARVVFGTGGGELIARDVRTGRALWTAVVGVNTEMITGANMVASNGVIAVGTNRRVIALDEESGRELWRYTPPLDTIGESTPLPGSVTLSALDADGERFYVPAWGASVSAVDRASGAVRWVWQPGRLSSDTAASGPFPSGASGLRVDGDDVYVTFWHFRNALGLLPREVGVVALDRRTGAQRWLTFVPAPRSLMVEGAPAVNAHLVIVTGVGGETYALNRRSGAIVWAHEPPGRFTSVSGTATLHGTTVYHDGGNGYLYALDAASGRVIWQAPYESSSTRDLLVTDRRVGMVGGGPLYVFDRATGRRVAKVEQPFASIEQALISSAPAAIGDTWFVSVNGGPWSFREP